MPSRTSQVLRQLSDFGTLPHMALDEHRILIAHVISSVEHVSRLVPMRLGRILVAVIICRQ